MTLQIGRGFPAGAIGTEGGQQPWSIDRTGAGETFKQFVLGMESELLGDDLIEAWNRFDDRTQLSHLDLNGPAKRLDDGGIVGQRASRGDLGQTLFNQDQIAAVMLEIEVLQLGRKCLLDGRKCGPGV